MTAPAMPIPLSREDDPRAYESFYHEHQEVNVAEGADHSDLMGYLKDALEVHRSDRWVVMDFCVYWIPRQNRVFLAPDVLVSAGGRPDIRHYALRSYRLWEHGPIDLVIEIGNANSRPEDRAPKLERYAEGIRPAEYLFFDLDRTELLFWRLVDGKYVPVAPDERGWYWSARTWTWFEPVPPEVVAPWPWIWAYDQDGNRLLNYRGLDALSRAESKRARAEAERAHAEAERAAAAELLAAEEAARRAELEARVAELERELARRTGS